MSNEPSTDKKYEDNIHNDGIKLICGMSGIFLIINGKNGVRESPIIKIASPITV